MQYNQLVPGSTNYFFMKGTEEGSGGRGSGEEAETAWMETRQEGRNVAEGCRDSAGNVAERER